MLKIKPAFSMIELLIVMSISSILMSIAIQDQSFKISLKLHENIEKELPACIKITDKIIAQGYLPSVIDFTASSVNYMYIDTVNNLDYKYVISNKVRFIQTKIYDTDTTDYTNYGIILDTSNYDYQDSNGNTVTIFSNPCYVYNNVTDSKPFWSNKCTPADLGWDSQN